MSLEAGPNVQSAEQKGVSIWIKLFVLMHVVAITSWSLPNAPASVKSRKDPFKVDARNTQTTLRSIGANISDGTLLYNERYVKPSPLKFYSMFTGFWQYWDMFSPNPASIDFYGTAEVTYKDGSKRPYTYPRIYEMGIPRKYVSERYRKFYERAHQESYKWAWPIFAQRVALLNFEDPDNPPVQVSLTRHWLLIAPPGKPQKQAYSQYTYYTHQVDQVKLRRDREGF